MNILITGGAGFIGSHLTDALLEQGHSVSVIDDLSTGKREYIDHHKQRKNFSFYEKDVTEDLTDVFALVEPEVVVHLAAASSAQRSLVEPRETHHININGTFNLLQLAKYYKTRRFIYGSTAAVYGDQKTIPLKEEFQARPTSPYALQKLAGEEYCRIFSELYNLPTISLRYFTIFGTRRAPGDTLVPRVTQQILHNKQPEIYGGGQTRDFLYITDAVEATMQAITFENSKAIGQVLNVGSGRNVSVDEVVTKVIDLARKEVKIDYLPAVAEVRDTLADISKIRHLLGWRPKVSLDEGLLLTFNALATKH